MTRSWNWTPLFAAALAALFAFSSPRLSAEEDQKALADGEEAVEEEKDPYAVPDGDVKELAAFLEKMQAERPRTLEQLQKMQGAIVAAADKLLAADDLDDAAALKAAQAKFNALSILGRYGDASAQKKMLEFAESLQDDKREKLADLARSQLLAAKIGNLRNMNEGEKKELLDELTAQLEKDGVTNENFGTAISLARGLESSGDTELAAEAYRGFGKLAGKSDDERIKNYGAKLEGSARRVELPGNTMEIKGKTLSGEDFDWSAYKGKVVLIDFWATWCGPCIAELPNVLANYEKYHDKGFDVVGISLDQHTSRDKLEQFVEDREIPWTTLFSEDPEATGWDHPLATHYGVMSIPNVILVNQEGKVVSLKARGEELSRLLEELLGPAEGSDKPESDEKKE